MSLILVWSCLMVTLWVPMFSVIIVLLPFGLVLLNFLPLQIIRNTSKVAKSVVIKFYLIVSCCLFFFSTVWLLAYFLSSNYYLLNIGFITIRAWSPPSHSWNLHLLVSNSLALYFLTLYCNSSSISSWQYILLILGRVIISMFIRVMLLWENGVEFFRNEKLGEWRSLLIFVFMLDWEVSFTGSWSQFKLNFQQHWRCWWF